jgi:hypothetical protein
MKLTLPLLAAFVLLSACIPALKRPVPDSNAGPAAAPAVVAPAAAQLPEDLDSTTTAERAAALAPPPSGERELGRTVTSLGDPVDPGFWLETPLVTKPGKGRVVYPATGQSVAVDLRPIEGPATGGSRISLPAMRLLGAPLTGLPELIVFEG